MVRFISLFFAAARSWCCIFAVLAARCGGAPYAASMRILWMRRQQLTLPSLPLYNISVDVCLPFPNRQRPSD